MKQFFRTAFGRTLLFLICVLSVIASAISIIGIVVAVEKADAVYTSTSKEEFVSNLALNQLKYEGYGPVSYCARWKEDTGELPFILDDRGNLVLKVTDDSGVIVAQTESADQVEKWEYEIRYVYTAYGSEDYDIHIVDEGDNFSEPGESRIYTVSYAFQEFFPVMDRYRLIYTVAPKAYDFRYGIFAIAAVCVLTAVLSFVGLMFISGRRPGKEEVYPGPLNAVPFDVMAACAAAACIGLAFLSEDIGDIEGILLAIFTALFTLCCFIGLSMSAATRIKQGTLLKGTLTARLLMIAAGVLGGAWGLIKKAFMYFAKAISNIPLTWKSAAVFAGFTLFETIVIGIIDWPGDDVLFLGLERLLLFPAVIYTALSLKKLRDSGKALAAGDLSHHTDTKGMYGDIKRHGEDLNNIAVGMAIAVEDRMKSERMKTELITNVSHDIKTPLTSIINYATLIGEEEPGSEKIAEYSEVLVRQSERLKRLIEDLVEASKASTGNLDVDPIPCDASVFLDQIAGEYEEKLAAADLTLISKAPDKEIRIMADGRRMWRIFDNLMNNICKYALAGTRVYLSLEEENGDAVFTFKNTSREELNISEEELMERFTRGDSSRNTEGNGLGLSIARSMAELQGGTLELSIDGDLFKAILRFPEI